LLIIKIEINNIFKGCNSLLIIPDISKWNITLSENNSISSSDISIKNLNSENSLISNLSSDFSLEDYNKSELSKNNNSNDNSIDEFYDNFYK